jgi:hypothetical protein
MTKAKQKVLGLAGYFDTSTSIFGRVKEKEVEAKVHSDGSIHIGDKSFDSPSSAGKALTKRATNGWTFWHVKRNGKEVSLADLRDARKKEQGGRASEPEPAEQASTVPVEVPSPEAWSAEEEATIAQLQESEGLSRIQAIHAMQRRKHKAQRRALIKTQAEARV